MTPPIDKYTKQGIVRIAQHIKDKLTIARTPANMRMSKKALVELWKGKISESDIRAINPPTKGRSGRPPNPKPKSNTTTSTQTTVTTAKLQAQKKKATKKQPKSKSTTKQPKITKFFKK
jgi:hypothetical protein